MLTDGFKLMLVGLSMVFIFLAFMILIINGISKMLQPIIRKMDMAEAQKSTTNKAPQGAVIGPQQEDKALAAAILTAVYRYRTERKKK